MSKSLLLLEVKLESADFCDQLLIVGGKSYKIENSGTMDNIWSGGMWMEEMLEELEGLLGAHQSLEVGSVNHTTVNLELSKSIIDLEKT